MRPDSAIDLNLLNCYQNQLELISVILAFVSFWPLLIIESVARVPQHVLFTHDLLVKQVLVKGELDSFNCKAGGFLRLFTSLFAKESNYNPRFCEKK